jgi:general secretion pathway protein G
MKQNGFTLIELLVVVSVLGVLATVSVFGYGRVMETSRDTKRKLDVAEIANALETYNKANGRYPASLDELAQSGTYIRELPEDPLVSQNITYEYSPNADMSYYMVYARLESTNAYFILTPQGKETAEAIPTLAPTQIPEEYPDYPTTRPTIFQTPTPTIIPPTQFY